MIAIVIGVLVLFTGIGLLIYFLSNNKNEVKEKKKETEKTTSTDETSDSSSSSGSGGSSSTGSSIVRLKRIVITSPSTSVIKINDINLVSVNGSQLLTYASVKASNVAGQTSETEVKNCDDSSTYCPANLLDDDSGTEYRAMAGKQMKITIDLETKADGSVITPPKYSDVLKLIINVNKDQTDTPKVVLITGEKGQSTGDSEVDVTSKMFRDKLNFVKVDSATTILTRGDSSHASYKDSAVDDVCPLNPTHNLTYLLKDYRVVATTPNETSLYYIPLVLPSFDVQYTEYKSCNVSYKDIINEFYYYSSPTEYLNKLSFVTDKDTGTRSAEEKTRIHTLIETKSKDIITGTTKKSSATYIGHEYAPSGDKAITTEDVTNAANVVLSADEFIISFTEHVKNRMIFFIEFTIGNYKTGVIRKQSISNKAITQPADIIGVSKKEYKMNGYAVKNIVYLGAALLNESKSAVFFKPEQFNNEYKVPTV